MVHTVGSFGRSVGRSSIDSLLIVVPVEEARRGEAREYIQGDQAAAGQQLLEGRHDVAATTKEGRKEGRKEGIHSSDSVGGERIMECPGRYL